MTSGDKCLGTQLGRRQFSPLPAFNNNRLSQVNVHGDQYLLIIKITCRGGNFTMRIKKRERNRVFFFSITGSCSQAICREISYKTGSKKKPSCNNQKSLSDFRTSYFQDLIFKKKSSEKVYQVPRSNILLIFQHPL